MEKLSGEVEWKLWEFDMLIPIRTCCPKMLEAFDIVDSGSDKTVSGAWAEASSPERHEGMATRSAELFDVMCQLTSGDAKMLIKDVPNGDGILALPGLKRQCFRKMLTRRLRMYKAVVESEAGHEC